MNLIVHVQNNCKFAPQQEVNMSTQSLRCLWNLEACEKAFLFIPLCIVQKHSYVFLYIMRH